MSYIQPRSMTWWVGVVAIVLGILQMMHPGAGWGELGIVLSAFVGSADASPAGLMLFGLSMIGIRAKLERALQEG